MSSDKEQIHAAIMVCRNCGNPTFEVRGHEKLQIICSRCGNLTAHATLNS